MNNKTIKSDEESNWTDFGTMLRNERNEMHLKNDSKLADALGITTTQLSEIINGKKSWKLDIEFLIRCRDFFGWKIQETDNYETKQKKAKKTIALFEKGYMSSEKVLLDMNFFNGKRKEILTKIIIILLFTPDKFLVKRTLTEDDVKNGNYLIPIDSRDRINEKILEEYKILFEYISKNERLNDLSAPPLDNNQRITRNRKSKKKE